MAFCTYQESIGSYETLASPRCKGCGGECTVETKHVFFTGKKFYQAGCKACGFFTDWTEDREMAIEQLKNGEACRREINLLLFPSDYFDSSIVDADMQKEYAAAMETGLFDVILFDYDAWFNNGRLRLNKSLDIMRRAIYRGWMMKPEQYESFYKALLQSNIRLVTKPEEYNALHMFPNVYEKLGKHTSRIMTFPLHAKIDVELLKKSFKRFMVKDYVKSVKGTEFPVYFDETITQAEFDRWMEVFYKYRGELLTGGICIKEYLDLKRYNGKTNEYRVFYANRRSISCERNSGQMTTAPLLPLMFEFPSVCELDYPHLGSPFYTVDFAELADGSWKVIETGDGGVSGLSDGQDAGAFYRSLYWAFKSEG